MARLRDPDGGCPWDLEQSFETIAPHTIEEAHEVADAIGAGDLDGLRDELGDLLFQVVFYAQMAEEAGKWAFPDVVARIADKMERRHPHVFGDAAVATAEAQTAAWEQHKAAERRATAAAHGDRVSALDGVPLGLPALTRALKLQRRAAQIGFDWPTVRAVLNKLDEERAELKAELDGEGDSARVADELGDILFTHVNLARHLAIDPETALRQANAKFERRFRQIETWLTEDGHDAESASLEEMETLWRRAKDEEKASQ